MQSKALAGGDSGDLDKSEYRVTGCLELCELLHDVLASPSLQELRINPAAASNLREVVALRGKSTLFI